RLQRHEIVETSVINQLHYHIELTVVRSRIEHLDNVGMIQRGSNARLLLQTSIMILLAAQISSQKFQRHEPVQMGIARFVNGAHPANTKRLDHDEMIEGSFHAHFLAAVGTGDAGQWLCVCRVDGSTASGTRLWTPVSRHQPPIVTLRSYPAMHG